MNLLKNRKNMYWVEASAIFRYLTNNRYQIGVYNHNINKLSKRIVPWIYSDNYLRLMHDEVIKYKIGTCLDYSLLTYKMIDFNDMYDTKMWITILDHEKFTKDHPYNIFVTHGNFVIDYTFKNAKSVYTYEDCNRASIMHSLYFNNTYGGNNTNDNNVIIKQIPRTTIIDLINKKDTYNNMIKIIKEECITPIYNENILKSYSFAKINKDVKNV